MSRPSIQLVKILMRKKHSPRAIDRNLLLLRAILAFTLLLNALGLYQLLQPYLETGFRQGRGLGGAQTVALASLPGVIGILLELAALAFTWTRRRRRVRPWLFAITRTLARFHSWNLVAYALGMALCAFLIFDPAFYKYVGGFFTHTFLVWVAILAGSLLLKAWGNSQGEALHRSWVTYLGISALLAAFAYRLASYTQDLSLFAFSLNWSETSRFYFASLFFSRQIYGFSVPLPVLHPSQYLILSLPYLWQDSPLWLYRLWQVFLWIATTLATTSLLVRRVFPHGRWQRYLVSAWIFLFLLIGPVYYHLHLAVILVLLGVPTGSAQPTRLRWLACFGAVLLASVWAGISRVNWLPVPGLLAATLYFLERPIAGVPVSGEDLERGKSMKRGAVIRYLLPPLSWIVVGTAVALGFHLLYIYTSGNPPEDFATHFFSALLWYRLLPNPTYPFGILLGIIIVSSPLALFAWSRWAKRQDGQPVWKCYHPVRLVGLAAALLILFVGGLVVSVKIGGGSNLHNLDAFSILSLTMAATITFGKAIPDRLDSRSRPGEIQEVLDVLNPKGRLERVATCLAVLIVTLFTVLARGPAEPLPPADLTDKGLAALVRRVEEVGQNGGEVLFIANRHLLTFDYVKGIRLIPEYERVFLMEMAIARRTGFEDAQDYLDRFHSDIRDHRFDLILTEPLYLQEQGQRDLFGEENDAWVKQVSEYVLCYYQEDKLARLIRVQFFVPNPEAAACPGAP